MELIETDFTKEFTTLLKKYKKTITADKSGIYLVDDENIEMVLIKKATVASEDIRESLQFFIKF